MIARINETCATTYQAIRFATSASLLVTGYFVNNILPPPLARQNGEPIHIPIRSRTIENIIRGARFCMAAPTALFCTLFFGACSTMFGLVLGATGALSSHYIAVRANEIRDSDLFKFGLECLSFQEASPSPLNLDDGDLMESKAAERILEITDEQYNQLQRIICPAGLVNSECPILTEVERPICFKTDGTIKYVYDVDSLNEWIRTGSDRSKYLPVEQVEIDFKNAFIPQGYQGPTK